MPIGRVRSIAPLSHCTLPHCQNRPGSIGYAVNQNGLNMTNTSVAVANAADVTPQFLHLAAAEQHAKAIKHHRQAAMLHDAGDSRQADTHGNIAYNHAMKAAETSDRALKVTAR
jgi:hypothetical protein